MEFRINEETVEIIPELARLSIAFKYTVILELTVVKNGLGGFVLEESNLSALQTKDYDAIDGEGPLSWPARFDLAKWGFISARLNEQLIGSAVLAFDTAAVDMLEGRQDLAVLWDIRVDQDFRGKGIGESLFKAAEKWALARNCNQLKIETQNTNAAACKFYARQGCILGAINRQAYPELPHEIQMLWYKKLSEQ